MPNEGHDRIAEPSRWVPFGIRARLEPERHDLTRPLCIDLFAGVGGLSLGFEQAGFDVVAAVELDPIHAAAHEFNFPHCAVLARSVVGLEAREIRASAGIGSRPVHVVCGGPPCQGFSLMGQRALDDPRNALVREFVRLVADLDASYFVFENVKGLTVGRHRAFLEELIAEFAEKGYAVRLPWKVLDSANYGVPQHRERLILLGARVGLPLPEYPPETHLPASSMGEPLFVSRGPTCGDALMDLPEAEHFPELLITDEVETDEWGEPSSYAGELRCMQKSLGWRLGYRRKWNPNLLTASMRTEHTPISRRRFAQTEPGAVEPISRFYKLASRDISNTLRAGTDSARGAFTSPRPIHYSTPRCITVREMARLHGFPDWFRFHVTKWHGARQIGNAVPPPFARKVAEQIVSALGSEIEAPEQVLELGDPNLLRFDMSGAAMHFGVTVPIKNRDRKSGAKKRRQEEIEAMHLGAEACIG